MPTYVLIHGANYDSRCWRFVTPYLDGPTVLVDLPGRGRRPAPMKSVRFEDFVSAAVDDVTASGADDIVLVAHSAGGLTAALTVDRTPIDVRAVVLVSCPIPADGEAIIDSIDPDVREAVLAGSGDGTYALDDDTLRAILCNDLDAEMSAVALAEAIPETSSFLSAPIDLSGLRKVPRVVYVRCLRDQTLPLERQDAAIAAVGVAEVIELDAGHLSMLSRPRELAQIIVEAGR